MYFVSQVGDNMHRVEIRTTLEEAHRLRDRWLAENGIGISIYAGSHIEYSFKPPNEHPMIVCSKETRHEIRMKSLG